MNISRTDDPQINTQLNAIANCPIQHKAANKGNTKMILKDQKQSQRPNKVRKSKIPSRDDERRTKQRLPKPQRQLSSKILQRIFRVIGVPDIFAEVKRNMDQANKSHSSP